MKIPAVQPDPAVKSESLEKTIAKTRELSTRAKPAFRTANPTAESQDSRLTGALAALKADPSMANHLAVADGYRRIGILDQAFDHYQAAKRMNPASAAAYDGMARVWRDWKLPGFGLGDAHRAVYFAPRSPEAMNTLGTVLQALGRPKEAEAVFGKALALDPTAGYALNNLCYAAILAADPESVAACRQAARASPDSRAALNNLGLALGLSGELELAREQFEHAGTAADAAYNMGIVHLAHRDFKQADEAFRQAISLNPQAKDAWRRLQQVHVAAAGPP
jgi:Tfp pilus assembly protein PilF